MKKHLLAIAFAGLTVMGHAQANFTITDGTSDITGTTQTFWIDQDLQDSRVFSVMNTSPNSINVKVRRTIIQLNTPTAVTSFCTGVNCYAPATNMSVQFAVPSGTSFNLTSDYFPDSVGGTGHVRYSILDQATASDSVIVDFIYNPAPAGINSHSIVKTSFSNPVPNPASSVVSLTYSIGNSFGNSKVVVYNMLGDKVKEIRIEETDGVAKFDVSDLEQGIYFCSLESDGKILSTKRLVVTH
jgi:hypothetical protein